uniref:Uncharacterized protein n=1 Tax=Romanomermis culicivorax TaxID=13658 RepID=A0A915JS18_ROMCU
MMRIERKKLKQRMDKTGAKVRHSVVAKVRQGAKVEFPEARIYEEAMNILLYEPETLCPSCLSLNWQQCSGSSCSSQQQQPPAVHRVLNHRQQRVIAASVADESQLSPGADHNENTNVGSGAVVAAAPSTSSGYCSDYEYRRFQQQRAKQSASKAAEI